MLRRNWIIVLLALALVIAVCTITDGPGPGDTDGEQEALAVYLPGLVVLEEGAAEQAVQSLGGEAISAADAFAQVAELSGEKVSVYESEIVAEIDALVDFVSIQRDEDPLDLALAMQDDGLAASPVFGMGFVAHWGFRPGTDPTDVSAAVEEQAWATGGLHVETVGIERFVGVVDSGIDPSSLPEWLQGEALIYDPEDEESVGAPGASHGTFVAGMIRQISPSHGISFAKARAIPGVSHAIYPAGHDKPEFDISNELDVAYAVLRLQRRGIAYDALNLSLGAYLHHPDEPDLQLHLLDRVLSKWDGGEIVAAAGNEDLSQMHWPAAFEYVTSVAAADLAGSAVDSPWPDQVSTPAWIDYVAPGVEIVGLGGGSDGDGNPRLVSWSGSSFATAAATGMLIQGLTPAPPYADAPGLSYLDASGGLVVNP